MSKTQQALSAPATSVGPIAEVDEDAYEQSHGNAAAGLSLAEGAADDAGVLDTAQATELAGGEKVMYMLGVPPAINQGNSMFCWAAGGASWLQATGINPSASVESLVAKYTKYTDPDDGSIAESDMAKIFGEMGMGLKGGAAPTYDELKALLQSKGHLVFLLGGGNMGHTIVVYGVGVDPNGMPSKEYFSAMDPMSGSHVNLPLASTAVAYLGSRK